MARPTKYTPEAVKKITDAIQLGATHELACKYAGISEDSLARWQARYADFAAAIKEAEGSGAVGWLLRIEAAAKNGSWQAAAWKLERRYPEQYGRTVSDHRHKFDKQAQVAAIAAALNLPPEAAAELAADADRLIELRVQR